MNLESIIEHNCAVLEQMMDPHDTDSLEYKALKQAASAYVYVMLKHREEYQKYMDKLYTPLSKDEQNFLDSIGPL